MLGMDFTVAIDDPAACAAGVAPTARLEGSVTFSPLADRTSIRDGTVVLGVEDAATGMRQIRRCAWFTGRDGASYRLEATTFVRPGRASRREHATAYARIFAGDAADGPAIAAGVLVHSLRDLMTLLTSIDVAGVGRWAGLRRVAACARRVLATPVDRGPAVTRGRESTVERSRAHAR